MTYCHLKFSATFLKVEHLCCDSESDSILVNVVTPKIMTLETFRSSVEITLPVPIIESGKIYVYTDLVLVNDIDKGIHIIDNSNPASPEK